MSRKQSSLNLRFFFLCSFVEEFQFSFNFESSVSLSFGRVDRLNFIFQLILIEFIAMSEMVICLSLYFFFLAHQ